MINKKISAIIPCYNEARNILEMYNRLRIVLDNLANDYEIIYIDNASNDNSDRIYKELCKKDKKVKVIKMSRNFYLSQYSYMAGLKYCHGDLAVMLDGDLQDPPEIIPQMVEKWQHGYKVVYGVKKKRKGSLIRGICSKLFYKIFKKLSYINIPLDAGDFSLLDRRIIDEIINFDENDIYIRGIRSYVGFKQIGVEYIREERYKGRTKASIFDYFRTARGFIINFSFKPLEWISKVSFFVVMMAVFGFIFELVLFFVIPEREKGLPTIIFTILFFGGIQMLCLSVIGEYLAKVFQEVKRRPRYIIDKILNDENSR